MANLVLAKGKLYFDAFDASGAKTGRRYLGNTPGFSISVEIEALDHFDSDNATADKDGSYEIRTNRTAKLTADDISMDNLALFVKGGKQTVAQTSGSVADELVGPVTPGLYYQLGQSLANPAGVRGISAVVVKNNAGAITYVTPADYTVDLATGLLYIVPGGAIAAGAAALKVSYTKAANTREQISTSLVSYATGELHFVADNKLGANRDLFMPKVKFKPTGEMNLKGGGGDGGGEWATLGFDVEILSPGDGRAALYIDGRPA